MFGKKISVQKLMAGALVLACLSASVKTVSAGDPERRTGISLFTATRGGGEFPKIILTGQIRNNSTEKVGKIKYKFLQWNGRTWDKLEPVTGPVKSIAAGGTVTVVAEVSMTFKSVLFRFETQPVGDTSVNSYRQIELAKMDPPPPKKAVRAWLTLVNVHTVRRQDAAVSPSDNLEVRVFDTRGTVRFRANQGATIASDWALNKRIFMDTNLRFELWELDAVTADDKLGTVWIRRAKKPGTYTVDLKNEDSHYQLVYRIETE